MRRRVWFHRTRAATWILAGVAALLWWQDSVLFVIIASVYANVISDWTAGEAADDSAILERLSSLEDKLNALISSGSADPTQPAQHPNSPRRNA